MRRGNLPVRCIDPECTENYRFAHQSGEAALAPSLRGLAKIYDF